MLVRAATNHTAHAAEQPLFRFALFGDTHYWMPTSRRAAFIEKSESATSRDGLLVGDSPQVLQAVLAQLRSFAGGGGSFAVHAGDSLCGGSSFGQPRAECAALARGRRPAARSAPSQPAVLATAPPPPAHRRLQVRADVAAGRAAW